MCKMFSLKISKTKKKTHTLTQHKSYSLPTFSHCHNGAFFCSQVLVAKNTHQQINSKVSTNQNQADEIGPGCNTGVIKRHLRI